MNKDVIITNGQFKKDSLAVMEKLMQAYTKAMQTSIWKEKKEELINQLTLLPTAPFEQKLMGLFNLHYMAYSDSIDSIIDKAMNLFESMQTSERYIHVKQRYFYLPFLPKHTYPKVIQVFNHEQELCYVQIFKLKFTKHNLKAITEYILKGKKTSLPASIAIY